MPTILLTNSYPIDVMDTVNHLVPNGFELNSLSSNTEEELLRKADSADYFIVSGRLKIGHRLLEVARRLKMIQRTGVGIDQIDKHALDKRGIPLYVNHGVNSYDVAEHTLMLILATSRRLIDANTNTKNGNWNKQSFGITTSSVRGKTIGIIGFGRIAQHLAHLLQPFNVNIICSKRSPLSEDEEFKYNVKCVELDSLFEASDIICLMTSLNDNTINMINSDSIARMKAGVIIINTARGKLINEQDLISGLKTGQIKAAGLDVFIEEPVHGNNELLSLDSVIVSPHISGITAESFSEMYIRGFRNIQHFENGELSAISHLKI
jgi:phosphoglycerate dehydrogenase-like enzyme